jgi:hypothetical protein
MSTRKKSILEGTILLILAAGCAVFYGFFYNQHLIQREQLQLFEFTFNYFLNKLAFHGGFADWCGEFLVQFFHLPFLGALILTLLFLQLYFLTRRLLIKISPAKPLFLFSMLPALGYLVLMADNYYSVSGIAGLIIALIGALFYLSLRKVRARSYAGIILIPMIYWLSGGAYLVFMAILLCSELIFRFRNIGLYSPVRLSLLAFIIILGAILPLIARAFLFKNTILQSFLSTSYYSLPIFFPLQLIMIFVSFPLIMFLQQFIHDNIKKRILGIINVASVIFLLVFTLTGISLTANFKQEKIIAYDNLVYRQEWNKIIAKAEKEKPNDRSSMVAVNLALAIEGKLSSEMFSFNEGRDMLFDEYRRKGMTPFISGEPYFYLGLYNFAQMFASETIESTPDVKYPSRSFRRMAETYMINEQYSIAKKYLVPLSHTLFHRRWANECLDITGDTVKLKTEPHWTALRKLRSSYDFYYNYNQPDIALKYLLISDPDNRTAYEYLMAYFLLHKDLDSFLAFLPVHAKFSYNGLPLAWQEALVYIGTRMQQLPYQQTDYKINTDVMNRIRSYAAQFTGNKADSLNLKKEFANTYWYYLHFR